MKTNPLIAASLILLLLLAVSCNKKEEVSPSTRMQQVMLSSQRNMDIQMASKNTDHDFINMVIKMQLPSRQLLDMEIAQGTDAAMKQFAQQLLAKQQTEVTQLQQRLTDFSASEKDSTKKEFKRLLVASTQSMVTRTKSTLLTGKTDTDFAILMLIHHYSEWEMAQLHQQYGKDPQLKEFSKQMATDKHNEMELMQQWLNKNM